MRLPDHLTSTESFSIILCIREEILLFRSRDENDKVEDGSMLFEISMCYVGLMEVDFCWSDVGSDRLGWSKHSKIFDGCFYLKRVFKSDFRKLEVK
jgi:hypothetical protein